MGKLLSINVGLPREIVWDDHVVVTSIWKAPQTGPVSVSRLNLEGDRQSDLTVHGGIQKAVYAYPSEHYAFWRSELPDAELPWGAFGENLTTEGLLEDALYIGDRIRAGSAEFVVTQPRLPCFKLAARFNRTDMVKRFIRSGRPGFYLAVVREGTVTAGDEVMVIERNTPAISVRDVASLYGRKEVDLDLLRRASELQALPESWRADLRRRLLRAEVGAL
ncbi:MAG TPA: MOSC domain-containing protein [Vicinamibacterales bacterium]|nr:MOSC domain-containing protein [Vicinamibacterales bacterium]